MFSQSHKCGKRRICMFQTLEERIANILLQFAQVKLVAQRAEGRSVKPIQTLLDTFLIRWSKYFIKGLQNGSLRIIPKFHLIYWCWNFVERHNFPGVLGELPETLWKLCFSSKFPYKKLGEITGSLRSGGFCNS